MLFYKSETTEKQKYFWNMAGGLLNALSSMILLSITTRVSGSETGGIFSLAYSTAQMLESVGLTNVREIQSTDVKQEHAFSTYLGMRVLTCLLMIALGVGYALLFQQDPEKRWAVILLTGYKAIDALADVFEGLFQLHGRIDLSGKELALRALFSTIAFFIVLEMTNSLLWASVAMVVVSIAWLCVYDYPIGRIFQTIRYDYNLRRIGQIFRECLPLFAGNFMLNYIINAPKYAIDAQMDDVAQNTYGFLVMPAFVINMFSIFYFRPILTDMAVLWVNRETGKFRKQVRKCVFWILLLTVAAEGGAWILGIPVLNLLSGRQLMAYRTELLIVMLGGAMSALITLFHNLFACMRKQMYVLFGYMTGFAGALILSPIFVRLWQLRGASVAYLAGNSLVVLPMIVLYFAVLRKNGAGPGKKQEERRQGENR